MTAYNTITFEEPEPGMGVLTLNRPDRLNAMSRELITEVHACLDVLQTSAGVRVLLVTGAGRGFCSGTDLKGSNESRESGQTQGLDQAMIGQSQVADMVAHFRRIPQPVIAAVNGVAAGGGFTIAMSADVRIAAPSARFIASYINIGLSGCEMGSSYFLPRLIGVSRASEILMTGRFVESDEAERIGLVSRVVPAEQLMDEAKDVARQMLGKSPFGLRMTKEVLGHNIDAQSLQAALELENRTQILATRTEDFAEAVKAFVEKRPPVFTGR